MPSALNHERAAEWRLADYGNLIADVKPQLIEIATDTPTS